MALDVAIFEANSVRLFPPTVSALKRQPCPLISDNGVRFRENAQPQSIMVVLRLSGSTANVTKAPPV